CTPQKCGRAVTDSIVTREEAETRKRLAERGLASRWIRGRSLQTGLALWSSVDGQQFVNSLQVLRGADRGGVHRGGFPAVQRRA
ncbi:hypothetical protein KUCAC02_036730, partial [Chaenocephalus aceratus]